MNQNSDFGGTSAVGEVLVTGATGDIGRQLVRMLVDDGVTVRALCRRDDQRDGLAAAGATPVMGSLQDRSSLRAAMAGCAKVFLLSPPVPDQSDLDAAAIDTARECGVGHVVRLSASDSNLRAHVPWARAHAQADHRLAESGLNWTVLRPSAFMQNFLQQAPVIRRGVLPHTSGRGQVSWIDTADVAAVAHACLTGDGHYGATYFLSGPRPLSYPEAAEILSRTMSKKVRPIFLPGPVFLAGLLASGQTAYMAKGLRAQFAIVVRNNTDVDTTHEVQRLLGRAPRSFEQWVAANIEHFT